MAFMVVTGVKELDDRFQELGRKGMARVARSSIGKGLTVIKKAIQKAIPPAAKYADRGHQTKTIRGAIGTSMKVSKITGQQEAKVGAAVGKKQSAIRAFVRPGKKRGGVGISANNIHWYIMGTDRRYTRKKAYRGRMPQEPAVRRGAAASMQQANDVIIESIRTGIARENDRLKRGN